MAQFVLLNARIFAGAADLTSHANQVNVTAEINEANVTNFASNGWKESLGGLASTTLDGSGQWEAGDPGLVDNQTWDTLSNRAIHPWTIAPQSAAVGELTWFTQVLRTSYKLFSTVGEVAPWEANASGTVPLLRGTSGHPPGVVETADGAGQGLNLGDVGSGQRIWSALHVLSVAGSSPTLDVTIESDEDDSWGSPATQITFDTATTVGAQFASTSGPISDTWWRVSWAITGSSPEFQFLTTLAIA